MIKCNEEKKVLLFLAQGFDTLSIAGGFEKAGFYEDAYDERFLRLIREC